MPRPVEIEDLLRLRTITSVDLSPDGRRIACAVRTAREDRTGYVSHLYVLDAESGAASRFTSGDREDGSPRFSPDGERIAFVRTEGNSVSLRILPARGGESEPAAGLPPGTCGAPAWSPDGSRLAFTFRRRPEYPENTKDSKVPVVRPVERLAYRLEGRGFHAGEYAHVWVADPSTRTAAPVTEGPQDDGWPAWSPDGQRIAFTSSRRADADLVPEHSDLWVVAASGGTPRRLDTPPGPVAAPSFSPDGRWIAWVGHEHERDAWGARNLHVWVSPSEPAGGSGGGSRGQGTRDLMPGFDRPVWNVTVTDTRPAFVAGQPPAWSEDGRNVFVTVSDRGTSGLCRVSLDGDEPEWMTGGRREAIAASPSAGARRFALLIGDPASPGEVHVFDPGSEPRRVSAINDECLAELDLAAPEEFDCEGRDGTAIHGWLLKPPGFDPKKKYPLLLQIHGGPRAQYGEGFFHEMQLLASEGYVVLYTNPRGSQGYGEEHTRAIIGKWGGPDADDLMDAVDHVVSLGFIDERRLGVLGGSYGGYMTAWLVGHSDRFAAAVAMRGLYNAVSFFGSSDFGSTLDEEFLARPWDGHEALWRLSPLAYAERIRTPLLIIHSEGDLRCPIEQAEQLYVALKRLDREVAFVRFPEENHDLSRAGRPDRRVARLERIVEWFARHMPPA